MSAAHPAPSPPAPHRADPADEVRLSPKVLGDLSAQLEQHLRAGPGRVRWRWLPIGATPGPLFAWTTDRTAGRYWSFAAVPLGPGARSLEPRAMVIARDSWAEHDLRKDARLRAWRCREQFRVGVRRPWRSM